MDVLYFLKARTTFIRQFYEVAAAPFMERKRKIESGEEPFEEPCRDEHSRDEPTYLGEWMEADESLHVLAYACISMLAAALLLYFKTWETLVRIPAAESFKSEFKKGWLAGYQAYFGQRVGIDFATCPVNLAFLEEVVLARNRVQHPDSITEHRTSYSSSDLQKLSHPFFVDETDKHLLIDVGEAEKSWLMPPTLHVTGEKLITAIQEVEKFCEWLEERTVNIVYRRY
jgi:hypothetical protein